MKRAIAKVAAFFLKEFHDVRRQPRLLLSLVGGPILVLAAFAATFESSNPFIRTVLVWPAEGVPGVERQEAEALLARNLTVVAVLEDEEEALALLEAGDADAVQIIPAVTAASFGGEERPEIRVLSRTVDPIADAWIRSLSQGALGVINQSLLAQEAGAAQEGARGIEDELASAEAQLTQLQRGFDEGRVARAVLAAEEIREALDGLLRLLPPLSDAQANLAPELYHLHRDAELLSDDLDELLAALDEEDLDVQRERLTSALEDIDLLQSTIEVFVVVPPEEIVSPIRESYRNLRGEPYPLVTFYTPAVLALLLQQLAITLGALGLVREREMGAFEMFRVAPLRFRHVLLGKSIAYIAYVSLGGFVLTGLLALLGVPMPTAHPVQYALLTVLLVTAATGLGFLVSALSKTDSQAIQLTMLLLLLSIFFTGFFLPITGFRWPAWIIALLLPMTAGIEGYQQLLLWGEPVPRDTWLWLSLLALLAFGLVGLVMRRQYRKLSG